MHSHAGGDPVALIGPNAVLQAVAVMEERLGHAETAAILADAQIARLPSGTHMIPEADALRLRHRRGIRCAHRRLHHRQPHPAPLLMAAIRKHAWTFIGAGTFATHSAWRFTIDRSRAGDPIMPPDCLFCWYAAVFTQLYRRLVDCNCTCRMVERDAPCDAARVYRISRG